MKKIFIWPLIAAAGAGLFYVLQKKNSSFSSSNIIGKWKLDSLYSLKDTGNNMLGIIGIIEPGLREYIYEFKKDGGIIFSAGDSITKDSSRYEWRNDQLAWIEHPADSTGELFIVPQLNSKSLELLSGDSLVLRFSKLK